MTRLLLPAAVAGALALCGCTTVQSLIGGSSVAATAPAAAAEAEKALAIAHLAYQGIGVTLEEAARSGALEGADAAAAQALYDKAGAALDVADQADAAANAQGVMAAVGQAQALIAQIDTLVHKP
jgi:hypothetical protein